ncbi:MAG: hypothetical protein SAK29_01625 [Scytonema sp. PMC 1069.18]|nr:hypothetical protein [Scytonema sp. PMC 1069.18]MEC4880268.1 hypothetical protein [Scytonema sp. PMC 1070.18]
MNISTDDAREIGQKLKQLLDIFRKDSSQSYFLRDLLQKTGWMENDLRFVLEIAVAAEFIQENVREDKILYVLN